MVSIDIFNAHENFEEQALEIFYFQATENAVYKQYLDHLKVDPFRIIALEDIPFLPISFFKT